MLYIPNYVHQTHAELDRLKQIATRENGDETKIARKNLIAVAELMDGESGILDYLVSLRNQAQAKKSAFKIDHSKASELEPTVLAPDGPMPRARAGRPNRLNSQSDIR